MSACRIGRRLALRAWLQHPCSQAVSPRTLARKVSHCLCHLFSPWRGGQRLVGDGAPSMIAPQGGGACPLPGVSPFHGRGGTRRFPWQVAPAITPCITSSLVTKGQKNGGAE
jgi:hypothetical protein